MDNNTEARKLIHVVQGGKWFAQFDQVKGGKALYLSLND
jgi:hypothetical protein